MDHRLYFIIGDLFSNISVGILMAVLATLLISAGSAWNMFIAMALMMLLAMVLCLFLALLLGSFFGAHEIMVPVMFSGMFSGMWLAMAPVPVLQLVYLGAATGLVVICIIWFINAQLRGIRTTGIS